MDMKKCDSKKCQAIVLEKKSYSVGVYDSGGIELLALDLCKKHYNELMTFLAKL